ncbi:hypothetical protein Ct61P_15118 [Colletotrichum tofieldiae]|nr:hypothetical protein Ct61P_15118 [Colletotrichum tofieldiae]
MDTNDDGRHDNSDDEYKRSVALAQQALREQAEREERREVKREERRQQRAQLRQAPVSTDYKVPAESTNIGDMNEEPEIASYHDWQVEGRKREE